MKAVAPRRSARRRHALRAPLRRRAPVVGSRSACGSRPRAVGLRWFAGGGGRTRRSRLRAPRRAAKVRGHCLAPQAAPAPRAPAGSPPAPRGPARPLAGAGAGAQLRAARSRSRGSLRSAPLGLARRPTLWGGGARPGVFSLPLGPTAGPARIASRQPARDLRRLRGLFVPSSGCGGAVAAHSSGSISGALRVVPLSLSSPRRARGGDGPVPGRGAARSGGAA